MPLPDDMRDIDSDESEDEPPRGSKNKKKTKDSSLQSKAASKVVKNKMKFDKHGKFIKKIKAIKGAKTKAVKGAKAKKLKGKWLVKKGKKGEKPRLVKLVKVKGKGKLVKVKGKKGNKPGSRAESKAGSRASGSQAK
jgi:hypothetical protein